MIYPIVIPLHKRGGKFRNNTELRYALRSIEKHFQGDCEVHLACTKMPSGFEGCHHLHDGGSGLKTALIKASEAFPDGFFWWYDDCVLLLPQTASDIQKTIACRGWSKVQTKWSEQLLSVKKRLEDEGYVAWDYSRPHGPYWFNKSMVDEGFADWPGMKNKFPWESWILSKRDWPRRHGNYKQYYGAFNRRPNPDEVLLNFCDGGFTPELRKYLEELYPNKSVFEKVKPETAKIERSEIEVHTIRFGQPWWLFLCAPSLDSWCQKHGHSLTVWDDKVINPEYPEPKYCEIDMLRQFLAGDKKWILYVDADVYVNCDAPAQPVSDKGFWIREDLPGGGPRDFRRWLKRNSKSAPNWQYRNAGVWMCDRESAKIMLSICEPPYLQGCQEQHQWNWWLSQAVEQGLGIQYLPQAWNGWCYEDSKPHFCHIAGRRKLERVLAFRDKGFIPHDPVQSKAHFDYDPYRFAHCGTEMPMDFMHIQLLYLCAKLETGKAPLDRIAVEIGSYRGASTAALVEAVNQELLGHLHIVEIKPTESLRRVVRLCRFPERITLHTKPSWDIELPRADLVFIDGDHKWPAVGDTLRAITWGADIICMHDHKSWPEIPNLWGAHLAGRLLAQMPSRVMWEDFERREGIRTHRGFLVSVREGIDLSKLNEE